MNCTKCSQKLEEQGDQPVVCKHCGTLNALTPKKSFSIFKAFTGWQLAIIAVLLVILAVGGWFIIRALKDYQVAETVVSRPPDEQSTPTTSKSRLTPTPTPTPSVKPTLTPTPTPTPVIGSRKTSTATLADVAIATNITQVQTALQSFLSQYNLTLELLTVSPSTYAQTYATYTILDDSDLAIVKQYGSLFIDEWAKYPVDWVTNAGLKAITIVDDLFVDGMYRGSMPDPVGDTVYYDPTYNLQYGDEEYSREALHHEFNHLLTYNYFNDYSPPDPVWESYNTPGFTYGNGGASCYQPDNDCLTGEHPIAGFVTGYGASGIEEDKAELYAYLMTGVYYQKLIGWVLTDSNLAQKVTNYKQFIASHSATMSGTYFDDINL